MADSQKICMIGPTYPFRGGIAHYTTLLYRALRRRHDVKFYAFKRQYPRWLYPGRDDRDTSGFAVKEDGVELILDSLNPLSWGRVGRRIVKDAPDLLILPWWVSFWTPQFLTIIRIARRSPSTRILFICHNVVQHDARRWDRLCAKSVLRKGDCFLVHSDEDYRNLRQIVPGARVRKVFHPTYEVFHRERLSQAEARERLGVSGRTLLFFGFVRPYKGLTYLLDAMPEIVDKTGAHLIVAGEFWRDKDSYREQIDRLGVKESITLVDEYIPNEQVGLYFTAADLVVLPYTTATQSGIVQIAYAFDRPVVVTNVGGLPDVVEDGKTGFLVEPTNAQAIARAAISFYRNGFEEQLHTHIAAQKDKFNWDALVETVTGFSSRRELR